MCGIFGVVGGGVTPELINTANHLLRHRGPDDRGSVQFDEGAFAHCRLSIIDLTSGGHQPMTSGDGAVSVTYNGEIYNYQELRLELEPHYPFRTASDTEVILAAYQRWGNACLERLRGMFAFGLWDRRRRRLLCATDRLSIKPLLYVVERDRFLFASEVKPLAVAGVPLRPNRHRVYDYLRRGLIDHTDETLFDGVSQLRPGTYLTRDARGIEIRRYWDLADLDEVPWREPASLEALEAVLQEAVDLHLRGDVEPALSLSSGLDSNLLRALIQRGGRHGGLQCFTYCFPGTPYDECGRVRPAIAAANIRHRTTDVTPETFMARLHALVRVMEAPVGGLGIFGYWLNCQRVSEHGLKVLLDGQGADEGFAGYKYYYGAKLGELERLGDSGGLREELDHFNAVHDSAVAYPSAEFERLVLRDEPQARVRAPDGTALDSNYLAPDFEDAAGSRPEPLPAPFRDPVKTAMYRDLFYVKIPKLLRFQDRCAMAWSVEVRVPFLDHVLLEHLFRTPSGVLLSGGITKALLRRIAARHLPAPDDAPKLYVSAPQREWIKSTLRSDINAMIDGSSLAADGYIDRGALQRQYDTYCASSDLGNSFFVWKFINLELWYRSYIVSGDQFEASVEAHTHV